MMAETQTQTINLTIEGKACVGEKGMTILEVAKANDIHIPTLCHHPWLSNHGACRMCVVEVEGNRRLVTACAAPAEDKMVVTVNNEKLSLMRQMTLELLFAERNHICPFCPSTGNCELQSRAYEEGITHTRYQYLFPVLEPDTSHPYFVQDHNRCILCGRCVRACSEVVGVGTLDFGHRGSKELVIADIGVPLGESTCIGCGTCVDVCPTGSLFEKRAPYFAKGGDFVKQMFICPDDDMGCAMNVVLKSGCIARIEGSDAAPVNGPLLSRRARYEILNEPNVRLTRPQVRNEAGVLEDVSWEEAVDAAARLLNTAIDGAAAGAEGESHSVAGRCSGRLPLETLKSFYDFVSETCGSGHVDTFFGRHRQAKRAAASLAGDPVECGFDAIEESDLVVLVGFDPVATHQVLGAWLARKRHHDGCQVISINSRATKTASLSSLNIRARRGSEHMVILGMLCQLLDSAKLSRRVDRATEERWRSHPASRVAVEAHVAATDVEEAGKLYAKAKKPVILYGPDLHSQGNPMVIGLLWDMARVTGHQTADGALLVRGFQTDANAEGAEQLGFRGADIPGAGAVYLVAGDDPYEPGAQVADELESSPHVILQASHAGPLVRYAKVILPSLKWSERGGTWVNVMGQAQTFEACTQPPAGVQSDEAVWSAVRERMFALREQSLAQQEAGHE